MLLQQARCIFPEGAGVVDDEHLDFAVAKHARDGTRHVLDPGHVVLDDIVGNTAFEHGRSMPVVEKPGQHDDRQADGLQQVDDLAVGRIGQVQAGHGDEEARPVPLDLAAGLSQRCRQHAIDTFDEAQARDDRTRQCPAVLDQQHAARLVDTRPVWRKNWLS